MKLIIKQRWKRTLFEKFENYKSVLNESIFKNIDKEFYKSNNNSEHFFNKLPYIGIIYIPLNSKFSNFWYDCDYGTILPDNKEYIKTKILSCDKKYVSFVNYDNHHKYFVVFKNREHKNYYLEGNILKFKEITNEIDI